MSLRDRNKQARQLFGEQAAVVSDAGVRLRLGQQDYPLPVASDTDIGLALIYASQHGPEALLDQINVCRHPGDGCYISVPFSSLWHIHSRYVSGGVGRRTHYPALYARMSCGSIPPGAYFGHSCAHGPGPHEILVCITKIANPTTYRRLRAFAEDRDRLQAEVFGWGPR